MEDYGINKDKNKNKYYNKMKDYIFGQIPIPIHHPVYQKLILVNIPEYIPNIEYKYFRFLYKQFFTEKYTNLSPFKKRLFRDSDEYSQIKYYFNLCRFNHFLTFASVFTCFSAAFEVLRTTTITQFPSRRRLLSNKYIKYSSVILPSFYLSKKVMDNLYMVNIDQFITLNSKFGIYLWFDLNFKHNIIHPINMDSLDDNILSDLDKALEQNIINFNNLDRVFLYFNLKSHYMNMYIANKILKQANGNMYKKKADENQYKDEKWRMIRKANNFIKREINKLIFEEEDSIIYPDVNINTFDKYLNLEDLNTLLKVYFQVELLKNQIY